MRSFRLILIDKLELLMPNNIITEIMYYNEIIKYNILQKNLLNIIKF